MKSESTTTLTKSSLLVQFFLSEIKTNSTCLAHAEVVSQSEKEIATVPPFCPFLIILPLSLYLHSFPLSQVANAPRRPIRDPATAAPTASAVATIRPSAVAPPSEQRGRDSPLAVSQRC